MGYCIIWYKIIPYDSYGVLYHTVHFGHHTTCICYTCGIIPYDSHWYYTTLYTWNIIPYCSYGISYHIVHIRYQTICKLYANKQHPMARKIKFWIIKISCGKKEIKNPMFSSWHEKPCKGALLRQKIKYMKWCCYKDDKLEDNSQTTSLSLT